MTKREIKKLAIEKIDEGKTKQQTYDELIEIVKIPIEDIAEIVRTIPTHQIREKYKILNGILISLLVLTIVIFINAILFEIQNEISVFRIVFNCILIFAYLYFIYGVATYRHESHKFASILTITGISFISHHLENLTNKPLFYFEIIVITALIGLGFYLNSKLFSNYIESKEKIVTSQGQTKLRYIIKFKD